MERKNIAGLSMKGGRRDNFYFCLLEYYPDSSRWFLKSLLKVKDEEGLDGDDAIRNWIDSYGVKELVLDFPLSKPACQSCELECPGISSCPVESVQNIQKFITHLLEEDQKLFERDPKAYERDRNRDDEVDRGRNILDHETSHHILSRSFKRRLKKGFLPYWNREIDFWVWSNYYDQLLEIFNTSYDSFGNVSLMVLSRFSYLRRHLPRELTFHEANIQISLLELFRAGIISKKDIYNLSDIEFGIEARLDIIKKVEAKLNIFIYENDLEALVKRPRAFDSFIIALTGQNILSGKVRQLPTWTLPSEHRFLIPNFA